MRVNGSNSLYFAVSIMYFALNVHSSKVNIIEILQMKKFYSIDEILERKDSSVFKSDDEEYKRCVFSTLSLFRRKLTEGSLFDCERLAREIQQMFDDKDRIRPSALLISQLNICMLQFYIKKRNRQKIDVYYKTIATSLRTLTKQEREQQVTKINSMILYDHNFEVIPQDEPNTSVTAVRLYKSGNIQDAVQYLKIYLNEYEPYILIKKVLIGKMLLQLSRPQAFQWLHQVIVINQQRQYQKFEAKVLFVSGHRTLVEKLRINVKDSKIGDIALMAKKYSDQMKQMNFTCSKAKLQEFKNQYAQGISIKLSSQQRKQHLQKAIKLIQNMPCYPYPSVYEYDIRIKLVEECVESGKFEDGKLNAEQVILIGNKIGLFNWTRQLKVNKALAMVLEHEGDKQAATELINRCIYLEQDKQQKRQLIQWKNDLNPDTSQTAQIQIKNDNSKFLKKKQNNPLAKFKIPQAKSVQIDSNAIAEQSPTETNKQIVEQKKCCTLI